MIFIQKVLDIFKYILVLGSTIVDTVEYKLWGKKYIEDEEDITGKVVIITGANRGIGKALAIEFSKRSAIVIMGCRDLQSGRKAVHEITSESGNENVVLVPLDLADMESVRSFCDKIQRSYPEIKILINNAGYMNSSKKHKTVDGFEMHIAVNHLGHFLLTNLLLGNLKSGSSSRVIAVSSFMQLLSRLDLGDIMMENADLGLGNSLPYQNSKFANSLFIKHLGEIMEGTGLTTYSVCPGIVCTEIYKNTTFYSKVLIKFINIFAGFNAEQSTQGILYCALSKSVANETGKTYRFKKYYNWANNRLTINLSEKLWDVSAELVQLYKKRL